MDRSNKEAQGMLDALKAMLLICTERLRPFTDEGFTHKDRRLQKGQSGANKIKCIDEKTEQFLLHYKKKLTWCIQKKKVFEIENLLYELTNTVDTLQSNNLYQEL